MWTYQQSTGRLSHDGTFVAFGYSGDAAHRDNPDADHLSNRGPIPRGRYAIGPVIRIASKGPVVIDLEPTLEQRPRMHGRGGFLIHGDSIARPGTASQGCIILGRRVREGIVASLDRDLEVVR
jgi:hypothetical protein